MTGDVGGESMHPDQHALAFVPGNPEPVLRRLGRRRHPHERQVRRRVGQCDTRALPLTGQNLADCQTWLSKIPTELKVMNAGLGDLQMYSISVSPYTPDTAMSGRCRTTARSSTAARRTWYLPLTGDGATAASTPPTRTSTSTSTRAAIIDMNYNDTDPTSWLWVERRLATSPRRGRPVLRAGDLRHGADEDDLPRRPDVWRTTDARRRPHVPRAALQHGSRRVGTSDQLYTGACGTAADWPGSARRR